MLTILIVGTMLAGGYVYFREGVFLAVCMCVNVLLAGLVAFNFWEPLADVLDEPFQGTMFAGFEDFFMLVGLFAVTLGVLRVVLINLAPKEMTYPAMLGQFGGAAAGVVMGYLLGGFLLCSFETLPWHENFMEFSPRVKGEGPFRPVYPPDRVWLSLMRYAGAGPLTNREVPNPASAAPYDTHDTFDRAGTFELRYQRYRRHGDNRDPLPYQGELDRDLGKVP